MPVASLVQPMLTGSSAHSTDSQGEVLPEAEEITDPHTLTLESKAFACGGYADVHRGTWLPRGKTEKIVVAAKILRVAGLAEDMTAEYEKQLSRIDKHLAREMHTWQQLHHRHITPLLGWMRSQNTVITGDRPVLVAPYYTNGNLSVYIYRHPDANRLALLNQAAQGLDYLHSFKPVAIAHLDIKAENILIKDDLEASICDFGVSRILNNVSTGWTTSNPAYTIAFASPEILNGEKGGTPSDVYSFAGLILYVLSGKAPFYKLKRNAFAVTKQVSEGKTSSREDYSIPLCEPALDVLWRLLVRCWSKEPSQRPQMSEVMTQLEEVQRLAQSVG